MSEQEIVRHKVLVLGDIKGNIAQAATKIAKLNKSHGPFTAAFCVGRFFGDGSKNDAAVAFAPFVSGTSKMDIPVYFICGGETSTQTALIDSLPNGGDIAPNLTYLGRSGVQTVAGGIRVAYLSGRYDDNEFLDSESATNQAGSTQGRKYKYSPSYIEDDVHALVQNVRTTPGGVDILLTCEWGKGWSNLLDPSLRPSGLRDAKNTGVEPVAEIASTIPTSYHFAGSEDVYTALPPYKNAAGSATRFYALASLGNPQKQKDIYAFTVTPVEKSGLRELSEEEIANTTECPYTSSPQQYQQQQQQQQQQEQRQQESGLHPSFPPPPPPPPPGFPASRGAEATVKRARAAGGEGLGDSSGSNIVDMDAVIASHANLSMAAGIPVAEDPALLAARFSGRFMEIENEEQKRMNKAGMAQGYMRWNVKPPLGYVCHICNVSNDHFIRDCPEKAARDKERVERGDKPAGGGAGGAGGGSRPPPEYVCHICQAAGDHYIRECPEKAARDEMRAKERMERGDKPPTDYVCHICNMASDHYIRDCPEKAARDEMRAKERAEKEEKHGGADKEMPPPGYICHICNKVEEHYIRNCPEKAARDELRARERVERELAQKEGRDIKPRGDRSSGKGQRPPPATEKDCWFCLATPNVATHLIASVGLEMYVALPRGPLADAHTLVLPIMHVPCSVELHEEGRQELAKYRLALQTHAAANTSFVLFYERHIPTRSTQHMQLQAVPLELTQAMKAVDVLKEEFAAKGGGVELQELEAGVTLEAAMAKPDPSGLSLPNGAISPYIFFEVPDLSSDDPTATRRFLYRVPLVPGAPGQAPQPARIPNLFDLPRAVAAVLVGKPERTDWKTCCGTKEEEIELTTKFKESFAKYDFNLED